MLEMLKQTNIKSIAEYLAAPPLEEPSFRVPAAMLNIVIAKFCRKIITPSAVPARSIGTTLVATVQITPATQDVAIPKRSVGIHSASGSLTRIGSAIVAKPEPIASDRA